MTLADASIKIRGYYLNNDFRSADIRALYGLTYNINAKQKKDVKILWPLQIDKNIFKKELNHSEIKQRNEMIRKL